jgi:hypothetical protein
VYFTAYSLLDGCQCAVSYFALKTTEEHKETNNLFGLRQYFVKLKATSKSLLNKKIEHLKFTQFKLTLQETIF